MSRRRILLWMALGFLWASCGLGRDVQAAPMPRAGQGDSLSSLSDRPADSAGTARAAGSPAGNIAPGPVQTKRQHSPLFREKIYRVKKGDTLEKIARRTGVSVPRLREVNGLAGSRLKIGQEIALYRGEGAGSEPDGAAGREQGLAALELEEDGGITDSGVRPDERQEQECAVPCGQWRFPEEQTLLVRVAKGFLDAPYRLGGASVTGIDCSAFVKKIYHFFDIDLPRTVRAQSQVGQRVKRSELAAGDLLFFNTKRRPGHVGIYIGNDEFVHASFCRRKISIGNLRTPYFKKRFVRAVRIKENPEGSVEGLRLARGG